MRDAAGHIVLPLVATAIAAAAGIAMPAQIDADHPCAIWAHAADENFCPADAAPYTILRQFAGSPIDYEPNHISVQSYTLGKTAIDSLTRSAAVWTALIDDDYPRRGWIVGPDGNQYTIDVFELMEGGLIGVDDRGRFESVFNFELAYRRISA